MRAICSPARLSRCCASASIRAFLRFLYTDGTAHITHATASDVLQMASLYGMSNARLAHHCARMLRRTMTPRSALETLCVAQQLSREELKADTVRYIVDHFAPSIADGAMLSDAVEDFPQLGVALLQAVAARVGRLEDQVVKLAAQLQAAQRQNGGR